MGATPLFEREQELDAARAALESAAGGAGAVLAVEGDPGVGKTALLRAIADDATAAGFRVLRARGVELEGTLAFGVVRQLLSRAANDEVLASAPAAARSVLAGPTGSGTSGDDLFPALHGLYWVCGALAERSPLLLVVDDAHWADAASLRFLAFMRERLDGVPALLALALRRPSARERDHESARIAADPRTVRLLPGALGPDSAARLLRVALPDASNDLCEAAHEATGGSPFYLESLARELAAGGSDLKLEEVARLAPEGVTRAVLSRLGRLGPDVVAVTQSAAVLGTDAEVRHVAALTGLSAERVSALADTLAEAGVLADERPLGFLHPIVRSAVESDLSTGARSAAHRRAARVLGEAGAPPERVGMQLLATEPTGDDWVVATLADAARAVTGPGSQETAVALLRRALAEPPSAAARPAVLRALGSAERHVMAPEAADRIEEALGLTTDPGARVELTVELAAALEQQGKIGGAVALIDAALAALDEQDGARADDEALTLEAQVVAGRLGGLLPAPPDAAARARRRLARADPSGAAARLLAGVLAFDEFARGGTVRETARLAHLALDEPLEEAALATPLVFFAMPAAVAAGLPELVLRSLDLTAAARLTGSHWTVAAAATWRALAAQHRGELATAEADATGALEGFGDLPLGSVAAAGVLADVLLDRRGPGPAAAALAPGAEAAVALPPVVQRLFFHGAESRVALARREGRAARRAAEEVAALLDRAEFRAHQLFPWRLDVARACLLDGDDGAAEAAGEQLAGAEEFGEPGAVAEALVVAGLARGGDEGVALLADAVDAAEACGRPLVRSRALAALGAAIRRAGEGRRAREPLSKAYELAAQSGADAVCDAIKEELVTAGARPPRPRAEARHMLTPSELRVCRLAAEGMTNREIAQSLFVTTKTVETHLRASFRKLEIDSRRRLRAVLESYPEA